MKKLLLAGLLLVSGIAFSASVATEAEGELQIRAEVVRGLSISTSPLDFGLVPQGGKNIGEATTGSITLQGQGGRKVLLTFKDMISGLDVKNSLVHLAGPKDEKAYWLAASLKINNTDLSDFKNVILDNDKAQSFKVTGTIGEVAGDAETGKYNGAVKIAATYEYSTGK